MKKKLEQGITLVVDRYAFSGAAFTSAKPVSFPFFSSTFTFFSLMLKDFSTFVFYRRLQGFCMDWCMKPDVGLPKPDLVMFLQLSPAEAALRGQFGIERYETSAFQKLVQQKFQHLMKDPSVNWKV